LVVPRLDFGRHVVKMYVKTSFFDIVYEVKQDSHKVSAGIGLK
jgi:hypothetical protein